ncbi:MAG: preprotein translocase subunit YajC [Bacteroidales bacterium]|nr:preprotein translocase subunit YajC [Bacteroidales bacterium]
MNLSNIILMANPQGGQGGGSGIIMLVLIILIFYFFMIRPQTKRQKEEKKFRDNLQKGQKILTIGGLHGKIKDVKETTVLVEVAHDVVVEMEKSAIAMDTVAAVAKKEDKNEK